MLFNFIIHLLTIIVLQCVLYLVQDIRVVLRIVVVNNVEFLVSGSEGSSESTNESVDWMGMEKEYL